MHGVKATHKLGRLKGSVDESKRESRALLVGPLVALVLGPLLVESLETLDVHRKEVAVYR